MFVFYMFTPPPMLFNTVHDRACGKARGPAEYAALEQQVPGGGRRAARCRTAAGRCRATREPAAIAARKARVHQLGAESQGVRAEAVALVKEVSGDSTYNDVNYVFPTYIVTQLPVGLVGLDDGGDLRRGDVDDLRRAVGALDFNGDRLLPPLGSRRRRRAALAGVSKVAMVFWAVFASIVAMWAAELGSLIEVVNRFGSFFYGSILGVFLLAIGWKRANSTGAFVGADRRHERGRLGGDQHDDRVPVAQPDRRRRGVRRRHDRQRL